MLEGCFKKKGIQHQTLIFQINYYSSHTKVNGDVRLNYHNVMRYDRYLIIKKTQVSFHSLYLFPDSWNCEFSWTSTNLLFGVLPRLSTKVHNLLNFIFFSLTHIKCSEDRDFVSEVPYYQKTTRTPS